MTAPALHIEGLRFHYRNSDFALHVRELKIEPGASVAFIGPSGSGKTTLLNLIAGIQLPDDGRITVDGVHLDVLGDAARRRFRVSRLGLIFQEFELLAYLSVLDNILLPYRIGPPLELDDATRHRAIELARTVGLGDKLRRSVGRLSHGERQRVALCRALLRRPPVILADEPTGNLDDDNARRVMDLLLTLVAEERRTLVYVTHDRALAALAAERWHLHSGILETG